jgi:hypothetical protein
MKGDPMLNDLVRQEKRRRRLPPNARCCMCGGTEHLKVSRTGYVRCYEHRLKRVWLDEMGERSPQTWVELDHPAGQANLGGVTVPLRANAHRSVTEVRLAIGQDDWPAANGDPLRAVGHLLAGVGSIPWLIGRWLVDLAGWLGEKIGGDWSDGAPPGPIT